MVRSAAALLRTYPHTALPVELHGVDIGLQWASTRQRQGLLMLDVTRRNVIDEVSPLGGDIQHIAIDSQII